MVKLADTLDLGSNAKSVQVQVLSSVPTKRRTFCPSFSMSVDGLATKLNIVGKLCLQPAFAADRKQRGGKREAFAKTVRSGHSRQRRHVSVTRMACKVQYAPFVVRRRD